MSAVSEIKNNLSRKAWIMIKRIKVKAKIGKPLPAKWLFNIKKKPDGLVSLN